MQREATGPPTRRVTLDIDSSESPVHGAQEQSAYNQRGTAEQTKGGEHGPYFDEKYFPKRRWEDHRGNRGTVSSVNANERGRKWLHIGIPVYSD